MSISEQMGKMVTQKDQLRARRNAQAARLESLLASVDEAKQNLRDLDELLLTLEDAIVGLQILGVRTTPNESSVHASTDAPKRVTGNPKKEIVAQEVHAYLKAYGKPLSRKELFDKLADNGFVIRGANPEMVLSTMLWRTADDFGIERLASGGYGLKSWRPHASQFDDLLGDDNTKSSDIFD